MGTKITNIKSTFNFIDEKPKNFNSVSRMAIEVLSETLEQYDTQKIKILIAITSCPDKVAPSLGQTILDHFKELSRDIQIIDLVQGCSGGANGLILASQLCAAYNSEVLVVASDAALNGVDNSSPLSKVLSNGAFSCIVVPAESDAGLLFKHHQYFEGLFDVVDIPVGQNSAPLLSNEKNASENPWEILQIKVNRKKTVQFMQYAESYIQQITNLSQHQPHYAIMHQANPHIMDWLNKAFAKFNIQSIDMSSEIGNCGTATIGVVLHKKFCELENKIVLLSSFGTGGGINVGIWKL